MGSREEYALGFTDQDTELSDYDVDVDGELPDWLSGSLYRNGPAQFKVNGDQVEHWFDGLGMLNQYTFNGDDDTLTYSNRFLRSDIYEEAQDGNLITSFQDDGGLQDAYRSLKFLLTQGMPDNANVHVAQIDDAYVALTEAPGWRSFEPDTLETGDRFTFDDDITTHFSTAHLHHDDDQDEHIGYGTRFGLTNEYKLYRIPDGDRSRDLITTIERDRPSYLHSIGLSENYAVLTEIPFTTTPQELIFGDGGLSDRFEWTPEDGTTFTVIDRDTGDTVLQADTDPFFTFHHVNSYEDGDTLYVDLVDFDDPSIFGDTRLDTMNGGDPMDGGTLSRYEIPLPDSNTATDGVSHHEFADDIVLPRSNPDAHTDEHRYVYGRSLDQDDRTGIMKVDTATEKISIWGEPDVYAEEPVFVPRPDTDTEDDGIVLAPALDTAQDTTIVLALDGRTLEEAARAPLPQHVPFGFHGEFYTDA